MIGVGSSVDAAIYSVLVADEGDRIGVIRRNPTLIQSDYTKADLSSTGPIHYAAVFLSSTHVKLYRNGVLEEDATLAAVNVDCDQVNIGVARATSPTGYKKIDKGASFLFYRGSLSDSEIADLANNVLPTLTTGDVYLPCAEGPNSTHVTDTVTGTQYAITNPANNWDSTQDVFHSNIVNGFTLANNLWLSSTDFSATYLKSPAVDRTIVDGVMTATPNTTTAPHYQYQNISTISGDTYILIMDVKANGYDWFQYAESNGFTPSAYVNVNLVEGTIGNRMLIDPVDVFITELEDGWWRVGVRAVSGSSTGIGRIIFAPIPSGVTSRLQAYAGDGVSGVKIRKPQYIHGAALKDYFPTTDVAYDNVKIPPSSSDPTVDAIAGLPLTNPPVNGNNGSESKIDFAVVPEALPVGVSVPGDGVLDPVEFDGDYGGIVVGVNTATREGEFTLER